MMVLLAGRAKPAAPSHTLVVGNGNLQAVDLHPGTHLRVRIEQLTALTQSQEGSLRPAPRQALGDLITRHYG